MIDRLYYSLNSDPAMQGLPDAIIIIENEFDGISLKRPFSEEILHIKAW